jgi:formate dehydrogenase beta subunit
MSPTPDPRPVPPVPDARWLWENEPCRAACPVHTDAGAYVVAIAEGRYRDAYRIARQPNPFPSICGRVCAAPCETACRRGKLDAPIAIRALKRFVSERYGVESFGGSAVWHEAHGPVPAATLPSVGVIGGGPAGLSAAHDLRLAGHPVTVYEAQDRPGGMMVLGIPEYRLARGLISREIEAILELGVELRANCRVGADVTIAELLAEHAALFVAVGTGRGRELDIPGYQLDGVLRAVEFLLNVNQGFRLDLGERVVVVGGGNVAFDAARTALRAAAQPESGPPPQPLPAGAISAEDARRSLTTTLDVARSVRRAGVTDVTVVALESPEEMPAAPEEIAEAEDEGIRIRYRTGPHRIVGARHVEGLETIAVASVFDEQHRFAPSFIPGTEAVLPADTVILAVGQVADLGFLASRAQGQGQGQDRDRGVAGDAPDSGALDLERTRQGGVAVDRATLRSSHPRVWAGGDAAFGPRNLIDAVADGQRAAASIHAVLAGTGGSVAPPVVPERVELANRPGFRRLASGYDAMGRVAVPMVPQDRRIGFAEVEVGYGEAEARLEGQRCLRCFDNVMLQPELCILCGLCVDVCPHNCISIVRADQAGVGTDAQSALLLDETLCIRCGLCVNRCPPGALLMTHAIADGDPSAEE